jgi:hypothetical protein
MGTTFLAVIVGFVVIPAVYLLVKWITKGWAWVSSHWRDNLRDGAITTMVVWLGLFSYHLFYRVPREIRFLSRAAVQFITWSDRLPKPTIMRSGAQPSQPHPDQPTGDHASWAGFYELPESFVVSFGNMGMEITMSDLKKWGQMIPVKTGGAVPMIIKPGQNGDVLFSFTAWAGGLIRIENNKVQISNAFVDRNFSKNALEIIDKQGEPVFQMIRENASHITIYGIFTVPLADPTTGRRRVWCLDDEHPLDMGTTECPADFKLTPIFRYPYWKYPGEYATTATPSRHVPSDSEVISAARTAGSVIGSIAVIPASRADDVAATAKQLCAFGRDAKWELMCAHSQASIPTPPNVKGIQCYAANWNSTTAVLFLLAMDIMRLKCTDRIDHQFSYGGYTASGITIVVGSPQ